jgi:hypothetical protein
MSHTVQTAAEDNCFFDRLPDDAGRLIFEYLRGKGPIELRDNDLSILVTKQVCKKWQNSSFLKVEREGATRRFRLAQLDNSVVNTNGYPQGLVQALHSGGIAISRLPELHINWQLGPTGYTASFKRDDVIKPEDMSHPIMRLTEHCSPERLAPPGIAIKIQSTREIPALRGSHPVRDNTIVLVFFKNAITNSWIYRWTNGDLRIENMYKQKHLTTDHIGSKLNKCHECVFVKPSQPTGWPQSDYYISCAYPVLPRLLRGDDPDFRLPPTRNASTQCSVTSVLVCIALAYLANYFYYG